jgi:hypothetical protein
MTTGYEPLDIPKPVAPDIWIVDGPAVSFYHMPFPTRATIVRLADGGLWVHSPTRLTDDLAARVDALGPVRHLVAPNWIHYVSVGDWQARYPGATSWAAPGVVKRAKSRQVVLRFDAKLGQEPPEAWAGQIDQMIMRGSNLHREAVFLHRPSHTLILTVLIENFEPKKLGGWFGLAARFAGVRDPDGKAPIDMRQSFRGGRAALREDVERMIGWAPERVILAHGRWYERDGTAELKRAFRWAL